MILRLLIIAWVLFGGVRPICAQNEVFLGEYFGHNMVLQRSTNTLLYGVGPPGDRLTIRFKANDSYVGPRGAATIGSNGQWQAEVDLTSREFPTTNLYTLSIVGKKAKRPLDVTGILIGQVVFLAGWEGEGVAAKEGEVNTQFDQHGVRFLDLRKPSPANTARQWEFWPREKQAYARFSSITLRLAHYLAMGRYLGIPTNSYLGVVLTTPEKLDSGLDQNLLNAVKPLPSPQYWSWITDGALRGQSNRWRQLIYNKRHNIVTNVPPVVDYSPASCCAVDGFNPSEWPRLYFSFAGAIWPRKP
jgi:hypothetical protein